MWADFLLLFSSPYGWFLQSLGILGMCFSVISQLCKRNTVYYLFQGLCSVLFMVQFSLLGAWSGLFLNIFGISRAFLLAGGRKFQKKWVFVLLECGFVVSFLLSVFLFHEIWWLALLPLISQMVCTWVQWGRNGKHIRYGQIFLFTPLWMVYDIIQGTVGGVLCECFNISSAITSLVIHRRNGFEND